MMEEALRRLHDDLRVRIRGPLQAARTRARLLISVAPYLLRTRGRRELRAVQRSYLKGMPLCLFSEPHRWIWMLVSSPRRHRYADQRPRSLYVPHLTAVPLPEPDQTSRLLEAEFEAIADEYGRLAHREDDTEPGESSSLPPPRRSKGPRRFVKQGAWNKLRLQTSGRKTEENIERCPHTWAVVERLPILHHHPGAAYFSLIAPGTHVRPHCADTNIRLRYHLAIEDDERARIRVSDQWRTWHRGECLILDDSFDHEVHHEGTRERVVLLVDCWHPDLTEPEREFLTNVIRLWRDGAGRARSGSNQNSSSRRNDRTRSRADVTPKSKV